MSTSRVRVHGDGPLARTLADALVDQGYTIVDAAPYDAAVFAPWDPAVMVPCAIEDLTDEDFDRAWQRTMDAAVECCVEARTAFAGNGGSIVLTVPTTGLAGGDHYSHWAAAAEGVHILAKSTARQWGSEGIGVNVLAVAPDLVLADVVIAGPVSIATPALPDADPGPVLGFLCSPAARNLGGQLLTVDGGLWM